MIAIMTMEAAVVLSGKNITGRKSAGYNTQLDPLQGLFIAVSWRAHNSAFTDLLFIGNVTPRSDRQVSILYTVYVILQMILRIQNTQFDVQILLMYSLVSTCNNIFYKLKIKCSTSKTLK